MDYLGDFTDLQSVWKRYPGGGCAGDYVCVNGEKLYWNVARDVWGDPVPVGGEDIYTAGAGSLIVKGRVHLAAIPPVAGNQAVNGDMIVPVYDTVAGKWEFVQAALFGGMETVTITARINGDSLLHGYIECGGRRSDPSTGVLEITALKGSDVTLEFIAVTGYEILNVNIDGAGHGALASHTFTGVREGHTLEAWFREAPDAGVPPVYGRSDLEGLTYNSLYAACAAIIADYPEGLTKDISVTCISEGVDYRNNSYSTRPNADKLFNIAIREWNNDTPYLLTLDGSNIAKIDGQGFGGFYLEDCSNIVIRNFVYQNCNTYEGVSAPEETACIYATGIRSEYVCRNLYIENITINGQSTDSTTSSYRTRYGITVKNYENVYITNCIMNNIVCVGYGLTSIQLATLSRCRFSGKMRSGIIGHPRVIEGSGFKEIRIEDCDFNCDTFNEYALSLSGTERAYLRRNHIYNCLGPVVTVAGIDTVDEFVFDYNYLHDNLITPLYSWESQYISAAPGIRKLQVTNNLVIMSSNFYNEFFFRAEIDVEQFVNSNNIYIKRSSGNNAGIFLFTGGKVNSMVTGNNIYKMTPLTFYSMDGLSGSDGRSFEKLQALGYETSSSLIATGTDILISETGGTRNCLLPAYASANPANSAYVGEFDRLYKKNTLDTACIGAENYYAEDYDETIDATQGYTGEDTTLDTLFDSTVQYSVPADNVMILHHLSKNRNRFIKFLITKPDDNTYKKIALGKHTLLVLEPKLDNNGEYVADQLYNVEIV